jgi:hypothetical protein
MGVRVALTRRNRRPFAAAPDAAPEKNQHIGRSRYMQQNENLNNSTIFLLVTDSPRISPRMSARLR